ncbi:MAG: hypothetical protein IRZ27_00220 [Acidothermus cellulolyticus]|nr:hypothetical protein [Acidothermus cellulolyticus]
MAPARNQSDAESSASSVALRRCLLAVSVTADIDLTPTDDGAVIAGVPAVRLTFSEVAEAIRDAAPQTALARRRLLRWIRLRRALAERSIDELAESARPVGLPIGHELHPGPDWVCEHILGGCLDLGIGIVGLDDADPQRVVVVPPGVFRATNIDTTEWWRAAYEYLENMGALATVRWRREPRRPLHPMGDCDVVTLLGSAVFRGAIAADAGGMRAVAAPMRHRGWLELSRIDPAFVRAAAMLTDDENRGFVRPVLVTADEVCLAGDGDGVRIVLRDPAARDERWLRDVLYH